MDDYKMELSQLEFDLRLCVEDELIHALNTHDSKPWSRHEFYAILLEEVDELWDVIKNDGSGNMVWKEMLQIVAVVYRHIHTFKIGDHL